MLKKNSNFDSDKAGMCRENLESSGIACYVVNHKEHLRMKMLTEEDLRVLEKRGISETVFEEQLECFRNGFPYMKVKKAAVVSDGIVRVEDEEKASYLDEWKNYLSGDHSVVKFVPASGAASRMFKSLYEFLSEGKNELDKKPVVDFFSRIKDFAFYDELNFVCRKNEGRDVQQLMARKEYLSIVKNVLEPQGLNYGFLPKGLLLFHYYKDGIRTPFEEHLVEGALYAKNKSGKVTLHFTVSQEHMDYFKKLLEARRDVYSYRFGADYDVTFSVQKPSTDTVAVDMENNPFRTKSGEILFRPGGHGSLIRNLDAIDADVIFIKNIDNVTPDAYKQPTIEYKTVLSGLLVRVQKQVFKYQEILDKKEKISDDLLSEMLSFTEKTLNVVNVSNPVGTSQQKVEYLKRIMNRPLRVCGMVKNVGEPGGGPYLCQNPNGTVSAQILESSQFDQNDESQMAIMQNSTHFNPVDLVCAVKNYKGEKYNLLDFVDENTGFISYKSKDGRELKALERPGLWNGAMSDWNTLFVEVPIETFTPVKMVTDLLRQEHQSM